MWVPTDDDDNDFDKDDVEDADSKDNDGDTNNNSDRTTMISSMCTQAVKDFQEFAYHSRDVHLNTVCLFNFD